MDFKSLVRKAFESRKPNKEQQQEMDVIYDVVSTKKLEFALTSANKEKFEQTIYSEYQNVLDIFISKSKKFSEALIAEMIESLNSFGSEKVDEKQVSKSFANSEKTELRGVVDKIKTEGVNLSNLNSLFYFLHRFVEKEYSFGYNDGAFSPKLALKTYSLNCMSFVALAGLILEKTGIKFSYAASINHPFIIIEDDEQTFFFSLYGLEIMEPEIYVTRKEGSLQTVTIDRSKIVDEEAGEIIKTRESFMIFGDFKQMLTYEVLENLAALRAKFLQQNYLPFNLGDSDFLDQETLAKISLVDWQKQQQELYPDIYAVFAKYRNELEIDYQKNLPKYEANYATEQLITMFAIFIRENFKDEMTDLKTTQEKTVFNNKKLEILRQGCALNYAVVYDYLVLNKDLDGKVMPKDIKNLIEFIKKALEFYTPDQQRMILNRFFANLKEVEQE